VLVALAVALALQVGPEAVDEPVRAPDPRSVALLLEDCRGSLSRRELTLFANGTLRLREGDAERPSLVLHELDRERTARFLERLSAIDLDETSSPPEAPSGEWTEHCRLELGLPDRPPQRFEYDRYSTGSLALDGVRRLIEDLFDELRGAIRSAEIPANYRPALGDRLERADGELFEVVAFTLDGKGVELLGVEQPITLFVERERLREEFLRIAPRP
jgi:hypothetical protein